MSITYFSAVRQSMHSASLEYPVDPHAPAACYPEMTAITIAEVEESLVPDARGDLTPVQMVDLKLRALLGSSVGSLHSGQRQEDWWRRRGK
jgi:hypothetical protein